MSILMRKQIEFSQKLGELLNYAKENEILTTLGEAYRTDYQAKEYERLGVGIRNSLHSLRLAVDLNVLTEDENSIITYDPENLEPYFLLGQFWESIGGTWGGNFGDFGHFSLKHKGVK